MPNKIIEIQKLILPILKKNGVNKASIFGSFARGEDTPESDVDILIELVQPKGLLFLAGLKFEIEEVLGRKVDLLTYRSVNPLLAKYILKDEIKI